MHEIQEMITAFEKQGYRVDIHDHGRYPICWVWLEDRIVALGIGQSELEAVKRARKCLQEGKLL